MVRYLSSTKNQSKAIHNIRRKKTGHTRMDDIDDPYLRLHHFKCLRCGDDMEPYKQDEYGDKIMSCKNRFCANSKDFGGKLTINLAKLTKEMQLHSRYYVDYLGNYKAPFYNRIREYQYRPKLIQI